MQFAVAAGATAIIASSPDEKLAVASKLGANVPINYHKTFDWAKQVLLVTEGRGVDHVVEVTLYCRLYSS